ncbi:DUF2971 domain-containing protein [Enterobacter hormaechei]|uniref:DUF2971 domain-containing protein n=1 Tax=Enterobacter cloacae complex TaxID=354276 RepID=UPI000AA63D4C|nr:DUF2971 domain-containing protein [Enterobacter hormaechei]EHF4996297.1 DUF2971 domain-containing protein [Enterobacter hormaechei]EMB8465991.1 DUF2971 domain-containing protein [Enterobacter hormaechei]MCE1232169.1 DUF2971 domain-containing protein [Enterobacter hormaechei]MCE1338530.1 DUF2971 domain-containing protein [Enterobacter hormaechei]MDI6420375.1 DUF2971 domain-containing protein [Enterobacter hormaechei]
MPVPDKLFKHKSFNSDCMELIIGDYLYFANPNQFNDPLDCKVSIFDDIKDEEQLKNILSTLYQRNAEGKLKGAANNLHYNGQKTQDKISLLSKSESERMIADIYQQFDFYEDETFSITGVLANLIGKIILSGYSKGVLSLAEDCDCPLMWSHYADNHRGLCLGYTIPTNAKDKIQPINYTSNSRDIKTSQILQMLNGDANAKLEIEKAIFLRKASPWQYEKEWRMISNIGKQNASLYLSDIIFGMRCKDTTIYTIMKSLQGRDLPITFWQMTEVHQQFTLQKIEINLDDECFIYLPRCMESIANFLMKND